MTFATKFQDGLVKHYANYHGVFTRILKDMGLSRTRVKFYRTKIEPVFTAGPGNNIALELTNTAAMWGGGLKEE